MRVEAGFMAEMDIVYCNKKIPPATVMNLLGLGDIHHCFPKRAERVTLLLGRLQALFVFLSSQRRLRDDVCHPFWGQMSLLS
jgi:hypothetical protein